MTIILSFLHYKVIVSFPFQLSHVKSDLEEMDFIMSMGGNKLTEQLLPSKHSFFIRESKYVLPFVTNLACFLERDDGEKIV